jgi:3-phenylpropionate/trans-cinnamate dioxygenase ferredoxin reductase subunit
MIGIIGGGLAAAKVVQSYREAGGTDEIVLWSQDPHGPYHRPPLTKRLLREEATPEDALITLEGVDLRLGERIESLDAVDADTIVLRSDGATPRRLGDALAFRTLDDSSSFAGAESAKRRPWSAAASSMKLTCCLTICQQWWLRR